MLTLTVRNHLAVYIKAWKQIYVNVPPDLEQHKQ